MKQYEPPSLNMDEGDLEGLNPRVKRTGNSTYGDFPDKNQGQTNNQLGLNQKEGVKPLDG